jgi:hypothetical protein
MKPIHKFNSGIGATLCHKCRKIISEGFTEDLYCEEHGGVPNKFILTRKRDGKVVKGNDVIYVEFGEDGRYANYSREFKVGTNLVVDFKVGNFKWMTTKITNILEQTENYVIFVTLNSEYKLETINKQYGEAKVQEG